MKLVQMLSRKNSREVTSVTLAKQLRAISTMMLLRKLAVKLRARIRIRSKAGTPMRNHLSTNSMMSL